MSKIGLQMYSLKTYTKDDFLGTLDKVSKLGFRAVEFAGFFNVKAKALKKHMDNLGMVPCGSHTSLDLLTDKFSQTIEYNLEIGNKYIYCPSLPDSVISDEYGWKKISELFNEIGAKCQDMGVEFGYHNHAFEFNKFDGITGYEILANNTEPNIVKFQIDTFWVEYAGYNPLDLIEQYKDRLSLLHLKEMQDKDSMIDTFAGEGISDTKAIIKKAKDIGIKYIILEQEHFKSKNQFEEVEKGFDYVSKII